ncbi:MAG: hypothetical protein HY929_06680 [Euryarchaeota archaeon]|nr:hypothetical protein [Euryarchaeota archaeon]
MVGKKELLEELTIEQLARLAKAHKIEYKATDLKKKGLVIGKIMKKARRVKMAEIEKIKG